MSILGAMNTAMSGLNSQSAAFSNISENVANSQTVGFKEVDTSFQDILTESTALVNESGATVATPLYENNVQGTIAQSTDSLALAISGQGFFPVSSVIGTSTSGTPTFSSTQAYTRAGDFQMNQNGYLVNSAGNYLNGWTVNPTNGVVNANALVPIQVNQNTYNPVATANISLSANLPADAPLDQTKTPPQPDPVTSNVTVYDAVGEAHAVTLTWTPTVTNGAVVPNSWDLAVSSADDKTGTAAASTPATQSAPTPSNTATVTFGAQAAPAGTGGTTAPAGTISSVTADPTSTLSAPTAGNADTYNTVLPASLSFAMDFGDGPQSMTLNLGDFGSANGVTQYSGTTYSPHGLTQDGVPPGSYSGVTTTTAGDIIVNYSNGQSRTIAQVPVVTFNNPDGMQSLNGQAYTATTASGQPNTQNADTNGAGSLVTSSVENSNVDLAAQFSAVIVAQEAYSANTKLITTAQDLLQQTIDMKR